MKRWARIILSLGALLALAWAAVRDFYGPELDIVSCPSDNLYNAASAIHDYIHQHSGQPPERLEQLRAILSAKSGGELDPRRLTCMPTNKPLLWRPAGVTEEAGGTVLVMCPARSHGFIRRYAWAVVVDGSQVYFAIVRGDKATRRSEALFPP